MPSGSVHEEVRQNSDSLSPFPGGHYFGGENWNEYSYAYNDRQFADPPGPFGDPQRQPIENPGQMVDLPGSATGIYDVGHG